jgi:predicted lipid-binding transport protein (Tim44 family)
MHTASRRLRGATFLIVGALSLTATACENKSSGTTARSTQTPSGAGSATPTATPTPEVKDPAEKAVRTYFETINAAVASMSETKLLRLTTSDCECRELATHIKSTRRDGKRIEVQYTILRTRIVKNGAKQKVVDVRYDLTKEVVRDKSGKVVDTQPAVRNGLKRVTVKKTNRGWLITAVATLKR